MAKQVYTFSGKVAYVSKQAKTFENGDTVWTMNFYPPTAADRKAIKATGIKNNPKEDDGEKSKVEGMFFTFRSKEQYPIVDPQGNEIDKLIGNGSDATISLEVETFNSPKHGPQARSKLLKVQVDNLIEYVPPEKTEDKAELPA